MTITIPKVPSVSRLYFWALQVSFGAGSGAHLGLQWGADPPRRMSHVNWGGYGSDGRELRGGASELPSSFANDNTRDFDWEAGRPYRLRVSREAGAWAGWIDGTLVRHLRAPGEALTDPMMWSEVFADCDDPSVEVRWSRPEAVTRAGARVPVPAATAHYQSRTEGGCDNTSSWVDADAFVQTTATARRTPPGEVLRLG